MVENELQFFELDNQINEIECWVLFPLLQDNDFETTRVVTEEIGNTSISYQLCNTATFDIAVERQTLDKFNHTRFYRSEFELLLCSTGQMYMYAEKFENGKVQKVETLSAIGHQVLITNDILLSDVYLDRRSDVITSDNRLSEFREYIENGYLESEDFEFIFEDDTFEIRNNGNFVFSIKGVSIDLTYPYVLYVLASMPTEESKFKSNCYKIQKKQIIM